MGAANPGFTVSQLPRSVQSNRNQRRGANRPDRHHSAEQGNRERVHLEAPGAAAAVAGRCAQQRNLLRAAMRSVPVYMQVVPGAVKISRVIAFDCVTGAAIPVTCTV